MDSWSFAGGDNNSDSKGAVMFEKIKNIVVLGAGESGVGAALLAVKNGFNVFVSDNGTIAKESKDLLNTNKVDWEEGNHNEEIIFNADLVIKSPGIPINTPIIIGLKNRGVEILSEIEFASFLLSLAVFVWLDHPNDIQISDKVAPYGQ